MTAARDPRGVDPHGIDPDEFAATFARQGRALWLLAAAWVGRTDAQDLVQEAARIAWQGRRRFAPGSDLAAWIAQIVRHTGANWRRKRRPAATDPLELAAPPARDAAAALVERGATMPADADDVGLPDEWAHALATLSATARACLLLHSVGEHTFAEIGALLGLPENTAASHVRRARRALRAALAPDGAATTPPRPTRPATITPRFS